jgi:hypothetical protein
MTDRITRRRALQLGGLTALATALRVAPPAAAATGTPAHLRRSSYTGLSSRRFGSLELVDVADLPGLSGHEEAFSLSFTGGALEQGVHTLTHPELGSFELFLVPVGEHGGTYQAVIDRSVGAPKTGPDAPPGPPPPTPPPAVPPEAPAPVAAPAAPVRKAAKPKVKRRPVKKKARHRPKRRVKRVRRHR